MPAKLTLHPPRRASRFLVLREGQNLVVGRDPRCDLVLEDPRVSGRHACLTWTGESWGLADLGSKNGTSVNGAPASGTRLGDGDFVSFGGLLGRFERIPDEEIEALQAERLARLQTSIAMRRRLVADLEPLDLLLKFLESAMEVASAERGFVLVAGADGVLRVEVAAGFAPEHLAEQRFAGSLGALQQALVTRAPVVVSDAQADPLLRGRDSVVGQGLGVIACVPLLQETGLVGVLYVDSRKAGARLAELDLEILQALAEHTSLVIAGARLDLRIKALLRTPVGHADHALLEQLTRMIADRASRSEASRTGAPNA